MGEEKKKPSVIVSEKVEKRLVAGEHILKEAPPLRVVKPKEKSKGHKPFLFLIIFQLLALFIIAILIAFRYIPVFEARMMNSIIRSEMITQSVDSDPASRRFDWPRLLTFNPDVRGWLYVPGTNIDYPIVQGFDDYHYLNHAIDGSWSPIGSLFLASDATLDFSDLHHVIYGHNMREALKFGRLSRFLDDDFASEHPFAYVFTPDGTFVYELFSAQTVSAWDLVYQGSAGLTSDGLVEFELLMAHLMDTSAWWHDNDIYARLRDWQAYLEDQETIDTPKRLSVLTLSTCTDLGDMARRVIVNFELTNVLPTVE